MNNDLSQQVADSGWTHQALADALGVHRTTVTRAIQKPSPREVIRSRIKELITGGPLPDNKQKAEHGNVKQTQRVRE